MQRKGSSPTRRNPWKTPRRALLEKVREIPISEVIEHLGGYLRPSYGEWNLTLCPFHDDNTPSASTGGHGFICFACGAPDRADGKPGDVIDVAKYHLQTDDFWEAVEWLATTFLHESLPPPKHLKRRAT